MKPYLFDENLDPQMQATATATALVALNGELMTKLADRNLKVRVAMKSAISRRSR